MYITTVLYFVLMDVFLLLQQFKVMYRRGKSLVRKCRLGKYWFSLDWSHGCRGVVLVAHVCTLGKISSLYCVMLQTPPHEDIPEIVCHFPVLTSCYFYSSVSSEGGM